MLKRKKKAPHFFETIIADADSIILTNKEEGLNFLVSFFKTIRPNPDEDDKTANNKLQLAIAALEQHKIIKQKLQRALLLLLINTNLNAALTESGVPLAGGFWQELFDRLKHKVLPAIQDPGDFLYVIDRIFYKSDDFKWVEAISRENWVLFFSTIQMPIGVRDKRLQQHVMSALRILSFQVAQTGLEKEVAGFIPAADTGEESPFVKQSFLIHDLQEKLAQDSDNSTVNHCCVLIKEVVQQCLKNIEYIRSQQSVRGASLRQTYTLLILTTRLQRILILTDVLDRDDHFDVGRFVDLFKVLVRNENRKNSIIEFLSQGVGYLAYQIAEHKGDKGDKYITATTKQYRKMIVSAMWGGFIICFIAVFKNLLSKLALAPFWQGFVYSVNYSAGFIAIEETGSTLATKQPAFTASAVAASLDTKKQSNRPDLNNLAVTVAKVSRSQIASFFGNLIIVFPGTFLLAWLYHILFNTKIADGDAAYQLLKDQHPWESLSLLYACNTGFFLFASGIIAGYVQNKIRYGRIGERLVMHPVLRLSMAEKRRKKLAAYIEKHSGALVGSIALGFFLGMASIFGKMFGIPFDIRHITISAGNAAIGVYGAGFENIPWQYLLVVFLGVLGIGFVNFLSSFAFAFYVAVKSWGIHLKDYPQFIGILWRYFIHFPAHFIFPPKTKTTDA
jgi:site-specific recombinase